MSPSNIDRQDQMELVIANFTLREIEAILFV